MQCYVKQDIYHVFSTLGEGLSVQVGSHAEENGEMPRSVDPSFALGIWKAQIS